MKYEQPKYFVHLNDNAWSVFPNSDEDNPKLEHFHDALTFCYNQGIKYKVKAKAVGFDDEPFDDMPFEQAFKYQIGFYNERDAVQFKLVFGEHP